MLKKIDIFWSIYLAHRCFKFDVSIDDIIDVSKILRIPNAFLQDFWAMHLQASMHPNVLFLHVHTLLAQND
jgi:hypothetical protein